MWSYHLRAFCIVLQVYKKEKEDEMKEQLADNARYKQYRRYLKKGGPGQMSFGPEWSKSSILWTICHFRGHKAINIPNKYVQVFCWYA